MTDAAWTGLGVICAGMFTAGATVLQAKFSADKAARIASLEGEVAHLKSVIDDIRKHNDLEISRLEQEIEELTKYRDQVVDTKLTVIRLEAEVYSLKQYIGLLENRSKNAIPEA